MTLNDKAPVSYLFTKEELKTIVETLHSPLMQAFLRSLEMDCLLAQHEVELAKDINEAPLRVLANAAYAQGQIHIIRRLRTIQVTENTNPKED